MEVKYDPFSWLEKIKKPENATPIPGMPRGMVAWKNAGNGFAVAATHYSADPEKRSEEWFINETKRLRQDQIDREYHLDFTSKAGQKAFPYLIPKKEKYLIPNIDLYKIPPHWRLKMGFDFGSTNPTSLHIYAITEARRIISLWEFYKPSGIVEIAMAMKGEHPKARHPLYNRISSIVADPSIFKKNQQDPMREEVRSLAELLEDQGIFKLEMGNNDRIAGLERLRVLFNDLPNDPEAPSYLQFCERCENQWREFVNIVHKETSPGVLVTKNASEDVVKKDDHAYDEARYMALSVQAPADGPHPDEIQGYTLHNLEKELDDGHTDENDFF
jgi:hypothetical protein